MSEDRSNHTPVPWTVHEWPRMPGWFQIWGDQPDGNGGTFKAWVASVRGGELSDERNKANADFIFRACNSHDELVKALELALRVMPRLTIRDVIEAGDDAIDAFGLNPWCINEGLATGDEPIEADWIRTAIAKAKGEAS